MNPQSKGQLGEERALAFFREMGYTLLKRNYHSRFGEIDLIVKDNLHLVFVEVKLRKQNAGYLPREAVTKTKQEKLKLTAQVYLKECPTQLQPRFDVVEVYMDGEENITIEHIPNAFF